MDTNPLRRWQDQLRLSDDEASNELGMTNAEYRNLQSGPLPLPDETTRRLEARIALRAPTAGPAVVKYKESTFSSDGRYVLPKMAEYGTNEAALSFACGLLTQASNEPVRITSKSGETLWSFVALRAECDRRAAARANTAS